MTRTSASRELSRLLTLVVAVVTVAVLYLAKVVLLPLAFAILFAFLLAPLVTKLERMRLPRVLAIVLVILTFAGILGAIGWTVTRQLIEVTGHLPAYRTNITQKIAALQKKRTTELSRAAQEVDHLTQQIGISGQKTTTDIPAAGKKIPGSSQAPLAVHEVAAPSAGRVEIFHGVLDPLVTAFLAVVFTFFILLQREDLRNRLIRLTGRGHLHVMTQTMDDASQRISRYFLLQLLVNTTYGLIIFTALYFVRLPHPMLFGALAGLLRFIPYIGAPTAALLPTALSLAVFNQWTPTLLIMGVFFCMEVLTANFVEPHIYGKHTGLSSLAILVAAAFWTLLWGPVGLVLSVPLTVCLVVVGRHVPRLEFLTVLLGDRPPMAPMATYYQRLLAGDEREACEVLESYLKEHSLQELYDSVLIPALSLAEQDRHQQNLDESTVTFIYQTTRELVEELGLRREEYPPAAPKDNAKDKTKAGADVEVKAGQAIGHEPTAATRPQDIAPAATVPIKVVCIPARDDADEIVAMMLAQLLERAGCEAQVISLNRADVMLAEVSKEKPEVVCLSALPPFAMAHPRRLYSKLREQEPRLPILIGVWNYTDDATRAANEISRGEADHISTTLAQAVAEIKPGPPNQPGPETSAEPGPAANQIARPDRSPATVGK